MSALTKLIMAKVASTLFLLLFFNTHTYAIDYHITSVGLNGSGSSFDVNPLVDVSSNLNDFISLPFGDTIPLEYDILVNNVLAAQDRIHSFKIKTSCSQVASCPGTCVLTVVEGSMSSDYNGNCFSSNNNGNPPCDCGGRLTLWPKTVVAAPGDLITVIIDPQNLIPESDETNNVFNITIPNPVPAMATWKMICLILFVLITGVLVIRWMK